MTHGDEDTAEDTTVRPGEGLFAAQPPQGTALGDVRGRRVVWMAKKGWRRAQELPEMWAGSGQVPSLSPGYGLTPSHRWTTAGPGAQSCYH